MAHFLFQDFLCKYENKAIVFNVLLSPLAEEKPQLIKQKFHIRVSSFKQKVSSFKRVSIAFDLRNKILHSGRVETSDIFTNDIVHSVKIFHIASSSGGGGGGGKTIRNFDEARYYGTTKISRNLFKRQERCKLYLELVVVPM